MLLRYWRHSHEVLERIGSRLQCVERSFARGRDGTANETKHMVMAVDNGACMNLALTQVPETARTHAGFNIEAARRNRSRRQGKPQLNEL